MRRAVAACGVLGLPLADLDGPPYCPGLFPSRACLELYDDDEWRQPGFAENPSVGRLEAVLVGLLRGLARRTFQVPTLYISCKPGASRHFCSAT